MFPAMWLPAALTTFTTMSIPSILALGYMLGNNTYKLIQAEPKRCVPLRLPVHVDWTPSEISVIGHNAFLFYMFVTGYGFMDFFCALKLKPGMLTQFADYWYNNLVNYVYKCSDHYIISSYLVLTALEAIYIILAAQYNVDFIRDVWGNEFQDDGFISEKLLRFFINKFTDVNKVIQAEHAKSCLQDLQEELDNLSTMLFAYVLAFSLSWIMRYNQPLIFGRAVGCHLIRFVVGCYLLYQKASSVWATLHSFALIMAISRDRTRKRVFDSVRVWWKPGRIRKLLSVLGLLTGIVRVFSPARQTANRT